MTPPPDPAIKTVYQMPGRATRAIIDLDRLAANVRVLRLLLGPATRLMAVVKADGYGHGAVMVSRTALAAGAEMLGVATVGEAADLRAHGIAAPILLLGPCDGSEVKRAVELGLEFSFGSSALLERISAAAESGGKPANVHLKIDTGMHRFGASPDQALALAERAESLPGVYLAGISTHLASADNNQAASNSEQLAVFAATTSDIREKIGRRVLVHIANSAGAIHGLADETDLARIGIAMYGLAPGPNCQLPPAVQPVLSLTSRLARVHAAGPGDGVSYGHTYRCAGDERLGLLPIGYADGFRRGLSDLAWVAVGDARCPVRGRICMDQTVIGNVPGDAGEGDFAGICGPAGDGPSVDDLSAMLGTINYEFVASLGSRIPRYYLASGRIVATLIEGRLDHR